MVLCTLKCCVLCTLKCQEYIKFDVLCTFSKKWYYVHLICAYCTIGTLSAQKDPFSETSVWMFTCHVMPSWSFWCLWCKKTRWFLFVEFVDGGIGKCMKIHWVVSL